MKQRIIFCILVLSLKNLTSFCQESNFKFSKEGFTDYVVINCEGKTQSEMYLKTMNWITKTFINPNKVIKAQLENEMIRIEGSSKDLVCFNIMGKNCNTSKYTIEINFKDGRYKFDVIKNIEYLYEGGWAEVYLDKTEMYYNKKGEIRNNYKYFPEIANYFNLLNSDLKDYIISDGKSKNNNW